MKETEISEKSTKGIKNWKINYSAILSVPSNKTNLILVFSSPLINLDIISVFLRTSRKLQVSVESIEKSEWKSSRKKTNKQKLPTSLL